MKKASVILLAVLYFTVSTGLIVNMHYCMNRFASADLSLTTGSRECNKCGMHKAQSHGCCHDETKLVKLQDDENKTSLPTCDFAVFTSMAILPSPYITSSFYNAGEAGLQEMHSPPQLSRPDLYLSNCVFRI